MAEFRWIKMSLFLILELQITAVTGQYSSFTVRDGDDATLPCENVIVNQNECDNTNWIFSGSGITVDLVERGQIHENNQVKSDRLSVTSNCSLVVKKVTPVDVGVYHCVQHKSEQDTQVVLSVIEMNEHEDDEQVTLSCSVWTHDLCRHKVKWLYDGNDVDEDMETSHSGCYGTVTFPTSYLKQNLTYHEMFQCKVTDGYNQKEHLFTSSPQSSGEVPTTKTKVTTRTTENGNNPRTDSTAPAMSDIPTTQEVWWWYIIVAVGLAALLLTLLIVVIVIKWKKTTGNKTLTDEDMGLGLNPAVTQSAPETSQDTADPEGVSYASISYNKTNSKAQVRVEDDGDDEGDSVTYSAVKASSSSAGASADPSNLYATINKHNK